MQRFPGKVRPRLLRLEEEMTVDDTAIQGPTCHRGLRTLILQRKIRRILFKALRCHVYRLGYGHTCANSCVWLCVKNPHPSSVQSVDSTICSRASVIFNMCDGAHILPCQTWAKLSKWLFTLMSDGKWLLPKGCSKSRQSQRRMWRCISCTWILLLPENIPDFI